MANSPDSWNDDGRKDARTRNAAVLGMGTFAWYAMPDYIRSRPLRFLGKTALAGGLFAYLISDEVQAANETAATKEAEQAPSLLQEEVSDQVPASEQASEEQPLAEGVKDALARTMDNVPGALASRIGALGALAVVGTALVAAGEIATFRLGERLRSMGLKRSHTAIGAVYGSLMGYLEYQDSFLLQFDTSDIDVDQVPDVSQENRPGATDGGAPA